MAGKGSPKGKRQGGRKPGVPNKATATLRELAQQYIPSALVELARLANEAESESARVAAIKELFDRAYGKAPQAHTGADGEGPIQHQVGVSWMTEAQAKARGWA